jgi:hypothetical protein
LYNKISEYQFLYVLEFIYLDAVGVLVGVGLGTPPNEPVGVVVGVGVALKPNVIVNVGDGTSVV